MKIQIRVPLLTLNVHNCIQIHTLTLFIKKSLELKKINNNLLAWNQIRRGSNTNTGVSGTNTEDPIVLKYMQFLQEEQHIKNNNDKRQLRIIKNSSVLHSRHY